jgi:MFS family permease
LTIASTDPEEVPAGAGASASALARRPWLAVIAVCLGGIMVALDGTAVTIAAPLIARDIDASLGDIALIANVYLVVLAVGILPAGRLADRFGRRAMFILGTLGFGLCSLAISLSHGVGELVAFRAAQGAFGALLQPAALALLSLAFPRERLGMVLGVWGAANALAIGLGPVIAGFIVAGLGWPAVFLLNVPVALVAVGMILAATGESRAQAATRPLRSVLGRRSVRCAATLVAVSSFAVFGVLFLLTLFLQNVIALTPNTAGAWLLVPTVAVVFGAPVGGVLAERIGPRWPVVGGMLAVAAGFVILSRVAVDASFADIAVPGCLVGLGVGAWVIAATTTIVGDSAEDLVGTASAVQQVSSQAGGVLGIAIFGLAMSWSVNAGLEDGLREAGVSRQVTEGVLRSRAFVAEGRAPVPHGVSQPVIDAVQSASHLAYLDGMHAAFLLSAALIVLAAPLGLLLEAPEKSGA